LASECAFSKIRLEEKKCYKSQFVPHSTSLKFYHN